MRSRTIFFFVFIFTVGSFALPHIAHAGIPFFGPIIPKENVIVGGVSISQAVCPAGWGMLITVINNIISFSITIAIVFIAPIMIAYAGFLYMWESDSPSGSTKARKILLNTVVGIVIALAGWLIVDAIMAVLYNPSSSEGWATKWSSIITSDSTKPCLDQKGTQPGDTLNQATVPGVVPTTITAGSLALCSDTNTACSPATLKSAGFDLISAKVMSCIAMTESGGIPTALKGNAAGLFQIMLSLHPLSGSNCTGTTDCTGSAACDAKNGKTKVNSPACKTCIDSEKTAAFYAMCNVQTALSLYNKSGYTSWTCRGCNDKAASCVQQYGG